jgi:hypothetical protein
LTEAAIEQTVSRMEEKTIAQVRADSITHGNIARLQAQLDAERNESRRAGLEKVLAEQRLLLVP